MEKRVLVTGGAGFIGSALVRVLLSHRWVVRVVDRLSTGGDLRNLDGLPVELMVGDICDVDCIETAMEGIHFVAHLAAESHVTRSLSDPTDFFRTNVMGSCAVFSAAARRKLPVLLMSTDEVFGSAPSGVAFREGDGLRPSNPYAASKVGAEASLWAWRASYGLRAGLVRCTNNYGPRQHSEKAIPSWIQMALAGGPIQIHGQGRPMRDWLHVEDCAAGLVAIIQNFEDGGVWHLAGRNERTNRSVSEEIARRLGGVGVREGPDRPGQDQAYRLDDAASRARLDWAPRIAWASGMEATIAWYREHGAP